MRRSPPDQLLRKPSVGTRVVITHAPEITGLPEKSVVFVSHRYGTRVVTHTPELTRLPLEQRQAAGQTQPTSTYNTVSKYTLHWFNLGFSQPRGSCSLNLEGKRFTFTHINLASKYSKYLHTGQPNQAVEPGEIRAHGQAAVRLDHGLPGKCSRLCLAVLFTTILT